ncbi:galactokinase [Neisseria sp. HSC-16F19]|nr:galactokinase [Neisseria sp. HSC-16F19]MCP2039646.1 galactokinase [Neisseria sp. HSC-16F19]
MQLNDLFETHYHRAPEYTVRAPGRVNLIGEHTDYNDGFVLPCAIDFAACVAVAKNGGTQLNVYAADYDAHDHFAIDGDIAASEQQWAQYVRAVVWALAQRGFRLPEGVDMVISGNVPQGAGLSSSAALQVGIAKALQTLFAWPLDETGLALIAQQAENGFVGCQCGIMDQLASARGVAGHALLIDCRSLEATPIPMPAHLAVMIVHSHVKRGLVDSEYNTRRAQCQQAAAHFQAAALRDVSLAQWQSDKDGLDETAARRARYIIAENQRTLDAAAALRSGDIATLSRLMAESHQGMKDEFEITHPAVDALVEIMAEAIGKDGGVRMTGGGFGGCVVALLPHEKVDSVRAHIARHYHARTGLTEEVFVCTPHAGVAVV